MAKLSRREIWAQKTDKSKYDYKDSAEGIGSKKIKKYYKEKDALQDRDYDISKDKLVKDFKLILEEAGFSKNDLMEDYTRNLKRLDENKSTDVEALNYYLDINKGRTQEDLDVSLGKELRNFNLTMERSDESIAERNLAFSGLSGVRGKEEGDILAETESNNADYMRGAQRSFQDLDRLETVKNLSIETQYGRDVEDTTTAKERGIRDIDFGVKKAKQNKESAVSSLNLGKEKLNWADDYAKDTSLATNTSNFDAQRLKEKYAKPLWQQLMS